MTNMIDRKAAINGYSITDEPNFLQRENMFNVYRNLMIEHFNMSINQICFLFIKQFEHQNAKYYIHDKGYLILHQLDEYSIVIDELHFKTPSKVLKNILDDVNSNYSDFDIIINCNYLSKPIALKYGFVETSARMVLRRK